jgi:hypothetical protein
MPPTSKTNSRVTELIWKKANPKILTKIVCYCQTKSTTGRQPNKVKNKIYPEDSKLTIPVTILLLHCRFSQPPADLWDWYEPFLEDEEVGHSVQDVWKYRAKETYNNITHTTAIRFDLELLQTASILHSWLICRQFSTSVFTALWHKCPRNLINVPKLYAGDFLLLNDVKELISYKCSKLWNLIRTLISNLTPSHRSKGENRSKNRRCKARFPLGDFFARTSKRGNVIGCWWRQRLSSANQLFARTNSTKTGLNGPWWKRMVFLPFPGDRSKGRRRMFDDSWSNGP